MVINLTFDPCIGSEKIFILLQVLNMSRFLSGIDFTSAEDTPNIRAKTVFENRRVVLLYLRSSFSEI